MANLRFILVALICVACDGQSNKADRTDRAAGSRDGAADASEAGTTMDASSIEPRRPCACA